MVVHLEVDVQLLGGVRRVEDRLREGRVEILHNGSWVTVCDNTWDINAALVICRQLEYFSVNDSRLSAYFWEGTSDIILTDIKCLGTENNIGECQIDFGPNNCGHNQDVGIICNGM